MKLRLLGSVALVVLVMALSLAGFSACGSDSNIGEPPSDTPPASPPASTTGADGITVSLVARNLVFDKSTITVPAGAEVNIILDNQDRGIPHNFALYTDSSARTTIFPGRVVNGPGTITYQFTAPTTPGDYFFRCDFHPQTMVGTLVITQ
ncbi:MAG: hypothetical protein C4555_02330 [Dehalococcoidia bacterium]|nr:MAG: hypothetical protein C4555_02330 [Dehalococcoidia bacterium]